MIRIAAMVIIGGALAQPALAKSALAHPHIFVEAGLEVMTSQDGTPTALRISWEYDPLFSMLLLSDMGLDADFDGVLTQEERDALDGFDMNWLPGYHGDTHVTQADQRLALSAPLSWTSDFDGERLRSTHLRSFLVPPLPAQDWTVSVHDPGYYTRYTLTSVPQVTGPVGCTIDVIAPDLAAAEALLTEELDMMAEARVDTEIDFPQVGALFAETIRFSCPAR